MFRIDSTDVKNLLIEQATEFEDSQPEPVSVPVRDRVIVALALQMAAHKIALLVEAMETDNVSEECRLFIDEVKNEG